MTFERITCTTHPMYQEALALYKISFPPHEQRESLSQEQILQYRDYHFTLIYDGEIFVGLILYWEWDNFIYVEHFCIFPDKRNRRYGQIALGLLSETKKTLILEIDPPVNDIAIRRKGFYTRCGFVENPFPHIHPPYHCDTRGHELVIMSYPRRIAEKEYDDFYRYLVNQVMGNALS